MSRQNQLINIAGEILDEVRRIRIGSQQSVPEAARFETLYRRAIIRRLDELELFGADVSTASRRHRLSVAYVRLSVEQRILAQRERGLSSSLRTDRDSGNAKNNKETRIIVSVDEALANHNRLILRGLTGSGKTTLLKWVAVRSALHDFDAGLSSWNHTIPFFIRLRQLSEVTLPGPQDFPALVAPAVAETMPARWVHEQLESGRGIVLVDGIDEVPELQRRDVHAWLKDLVGTYPKARFIVTSRPHALEEGWMTQEDFGEVELQPMDRSSIDAFIDHWHDAVRESLQDEEEKAELVPLAMHLKEIIEHKRPIRNLATTPLLCAMICALNRERQRQLPSDRIELYEACCQMLMERRDLERRIDLRDYPQLSYRQKRALLQDFAYWLLKNGWSEVSVERSDDRFTMRLAIMEGISPELTGTGIRRLLVDRSGMIREPVAGQIDFTHRTFQEFLSAQAALDEGDTGVLLKNAHDDQWREVIILAAGLARMKERRDLLWGLIQRGDTEETQRHSLHLLAVACLETSVELEPDVRESIQKRLTAVVPPTNTTEAKELSSAGELAVPYLVPKKGMSSSAIAASIYTLSLIGGEVALNGLSAYAKDTSSAVDAELLEAADSFDRREYVDRVFLCGDSPLTFFHLSNPSIQRRVFVGNALGFSGDPRFCSDSWFLPNDSLLGFVKIEEGEFWMGSDPKRDRYAHDDELPQHRVYLSPYYIASYPVTVAQFRAFVEAERYDWKRKDQSQGESNHPVVFVSRHDAMAYCEWLTETLKCWSKTPEELRLYLADGGSVTLPSEAQWEKAARGGDGRLYPWGDEVDPNLANYKDTSIRTTSTVGCFAAGERPYDVYDTSGNVWEWCRDGRRNYSAIPIRDPVGPMESSVYVLRGGSWILEGGYVRSAQRSVYEPSYASHGIGFRIVVDSTPY